MSAALGCVKWVALTAALAGCYPLLPGSVRPGKPDPATVDGLDTDTDADTDTDTTGGHTGGPTSGPCAGGPVTLGPWDEHPLAQATLRPDRYSADAGVRAVLNAADGETSGRNVDLVISGAVVTATALASPAEAGPLSFWIADGKGAMMAFLIDLPFDPSSLRPGDLVDMRVLRVQDFFGVLEITDAQVQLTGVRASVYVDDAMTGEQLTYKDYPQEMVEVWGELVGGPTECGADCFELDYGAPETMPFRVSQGIADQGDCVHVIAPLDQFGGQAQLDMEHPDWFRFF